MPHEPTAPLGHRLLRHAQLLGHGIVLQPFGARQDDAGSQRSRLRSLASPRQREQLVAPRLSQHQGCLGSSTHCSLIEYTRYPMNLDALE
jgi:hypothetical protein